MASGKLGAAALNADVYTPVYEVPSNKATTLNILAVNRGGGAAKIRVAITTESTTPLDADFIEFDAQLSGGGGIFERTALVAGDGEKIMVRASTDDVSVRIHGFEEDL
ncbi:MAG: hypothetical protein WEB57_08125 [Pseudohongiellaceae bacterium]